MPTSPSSTSVGSGRAAAGGKSPVKGASGVRQRKPTGGGAGGAAPRVGSAGAATSWRFFTEDSPGFKVEPVPVLVMSIIYIVAIFLLHLWGKYSRG
ncbi:expressed hypothetical protein [Trichoplax adhaerens]|uniref:Protein transport protein Sec61 subunit beta n=1 Tax=Trichoplax adhaerens TaxID=10228 RepID=B3RRE1_TRIAD|nr:expressed hypothetical protein [Trichoplax adhaerens]EDV26860.1 expressed hypothetical protein [Trichoplax adhaerens]|eukprot:XP_002110856.1 expressed hypothetical protein [Trichoplax adhaerens]